MKAVCRLGELDAVDFKVIPIRLGVECDDVDTADDVRVDGAFLIVSVIRRPIRARDTRAVHGAVAGGHGPFGPRGRTTATRAVAAVRLQLLASVPAAYPIFTRVSVASLRADLLASTLVAIAPIRLHIFARIPGSEPKIATLAIARLWTDQTACA